jgi:hypothetical protein
MRTTLNISDAILAELRSLAAESNRPLREVLEETLQRGLAATGNRKKRVKIQPVRAGIKPAYQGMSMNQLYDQLEAEERRR